MANARCEIYNADGSLQFSSDHRVFLHLVSFSTGGVAGSRSLGSPGGTIMVWQSYGSGASNVPALTVSGDTISWPAGALSYVRVFVY